MTLTNPKDGSETVHDEFSLRRGGTIALVDEHALVDRGDEPIRIRTERITEVAFDEIDWFLVVMSVAIVGFGVVSFDRSALGGIAFVAVGILNFYITYRKRNAIRISVADRRKPVTVYPDDPKAVYDAFEPYLVE